MHRIFVIFLLICAHPLTPSHHARELPDPAPLGAVSSAHPLATQAGVAILESGGNAFDAAIAVAATLNVVEPMMSGMGGYGTILIYDAASGRVRYLDSSGKIPVHMNSDLMRPPTPDWEANRTGAKSISTPGNVNAWDAMSRTYGRLPWAQLFEHAIEVADNGFVVSERTAMMINYSWDAMPAHARTFYGRNGSALQAGDTLVQKDLASSLALLAREGRSVFYEGTLAQKIVKAMKDHDSFLGAEDLAQDRAEWWDPISIDYRDHVVYTASPPANAFPALIRLGLMERLNDGLEHNSTDYLHCFAEATKHAFWCRLKYAGDPEIKPPPLGTLLSSAYLDEVTKGIDLKSASEFVPPGLSGSSGDHTTHFVVADRWGNIVSATQTLGNLFGSKIMPEGTGIWFNNSLAYCTYEPKGNPMDAIPGQRKLSGDCPVILFRDGRPVYALGTPGGHTIPQTVPQMIINIIDYDMSISDALAAPRISFIEPDQIAIEDGIPASVIRQLKQRGHRERTTRALGNAHGLQLMYDAQGKVRGYLGSADPRGEGSWMIAQDK
ncbi:MAG: gamma-glutamyltransferase [Saprospiraceae bacterium]|nr:gamma-glutamyltransferase [Saprospiraceae bacterium]